MRIFHRNPKWRARVTLNNQDPHSSLGSQDSSLVTLWREVDVLDQRGWHLPPVGTWEPNPANISLRRFVSASIKYKLPRVFVSFIHVIFDIRNELKSSNSFCFWCTWRHQDNRYILLSANSIVKTYARMSNMVLLLLKFLNIWKCVIFQKFDSAKIVLKVLTRVLRNNYH